MKISVNVPSYKRPNKIITLDYLPYVRVWVDGSEYEDYKAANPKADIVKCADGVQGNLCRVLNYILDEEFKRGMDVVLILVDDIHYIERWEVNELTGFGYEPYKLNADEVLTMVEKYSILAKDLGAKFWGININQDKYCYKHNQPFSTKSYIGGPFRCHLKGSRCRYDERLFFKDDYDMTLQQLNMERVVLRVNAYHYICEQSTNKGGLAAYRNRDREYEQCDLLIKKWGGGIFSDTTKRTKEKRKKRKRQTII
jgi:hypothetical protein